ncbi:DUF2400 family protein [Archaeoglobus profundus]|uniref:Uncharacterized protein n=2 Tax=root TaxID=1 RepID=D2RFD3_ARCPA|nr:DUF2400 family protein [Archaeoglobus profundus]ADB58827.1 hypothetical protein Arcpr_1783 [Archaeoglobus profundus DSM 5631]
MLNATAIREYLDKRYNISAKYYLNSSLLSCVRRFNDISRDEKDTANFAFISAMYDYQMKVSHLISRFNFIVDFLERNNLELPDLADSSHFEKLRDLMLKNYGYFHRFDPRMRDFRKLVDVLTKLDLENIAKDYYDPNQSEPVEKVIDGILNEIRRFAEFSSRGFIPNPKNKSSKKRLTLFLRWVVRPEYPDLGVWRFISPAHLYVSLDLGVLRVFQRITGIALKNDWDGVIRVTDYFRSVNPQDPAKYDYVLSRPAILDICKKSLEYSGCDACLLNEICLTGRENIRNIRLVVEEEVDKTRHDYIRDLFKSRNPWKASCVREEYLNGRADIVCYLPDMKSPERIVVVEVKVVLTFNGVKQLLNYIRTAIEKWKETVKECRGAMVCECISKDQEQKILEISEYHSIEIYKFDDNKFVRIA